MTGPAPTREAGSFRDPSGFVVRSGDRVFRAVSPEVSERLCALRAGGLLGRLEDERLVVRTELSPEPARVRELEAAFPEARAFVEHERVPFVSFPCEWTSTMLCDAGLLHLRLQSELLSQGFALKDATAYNAQFIGAAPVFIDLPSIERAEPSAVWGAYGQFCRMFLFPLLLADAGRMDTKAAFLSRPEGIPVEEAFRMLGFWRSLRPSNLLDVALQHLLQRRYGGGEGSPASVRAEGGADAQRYNLERLRRRLLALRGSAPRRASPWSAYAGDYPEEGRERKDRFIEAFLEQERPASVLDLGCNKGRYARMAARRAGQVVAVDSDEGCVDRLYREAAAERLPILPLWMDAANPSPGLGLGNRERPPFLERVRAEAVFALALLHHLLTATGAPIERLAEELYRPAGKFLLVEYVGPGDPLFRRLLRYREDLWKGLTQERFLAAFGRGGRLLRSERLCEHRSLHLFRKHA